jgi:Zn-dependent peptidase ImmA (M78 family)/transcriptional regulator with XRE-family HTH domain
VPATLVPITPQVLDWAIADSGYSRAEVAAAAGVEVSELEAWLRAELQPNITQARKIAAKLHRQLAVFLLPAPPRSDRPGVQFRHPLGERETRDLNPKERRYLRRAQRLQKAESWLVGEMRLNPSSLPVFSLDTPIEDAAAALRTLLGVSVDTQQQWASPSIAFDEWRSALEAAGVVVMQFALGEDSCRGFSLWDDRAPLIAVNTAWRDEARMFTLFHELGHLVTRTNSACATAPVTSSASDTAERWCEGFAAAVLIPAGAVDSVTEVNSLRTLSRLARRFHVSLRATALRLITLDRASWTLYDSIPPASDAKRRGGAGGGRNRTEIRIDEFGHRTTDLFVAAVRAEVISESQALDYLDIPSDAFEDMFSAAR